MAAAPGSLPDQMQDAQGEPESEQQAAPQPPYKKGDKADELKCYWPGCDYKPTPNLEWGKLMEHVRIHHKVLLRSLQGTFLHQRGKEDLRARQAGWFSKKAKEAKGDQADAALKPKEGNAKAAAALGGEEAQQEQASLEEFHWEALPCWVKCKAAGIPAEPFECAGLAQEGAAPLASSAIVKEEASDTLESIGWCSPSSAVRIMVGSSINHDMM